MRWKSTVLDWKAALSAVMSQRRRPCPLADVPTGEDRQALPEGGRPRLPEQERSIFRPMADWTRRIARHEPEIPVQRRNATGMVVERGGKPSLYPTYTR
jgi:hypothetical protein